MKKYFSILIEILFIISNLCGEFKLDIKSRFYSGIEFSKNIELKDNSDISSTKGLFVNDTLFSLNQDNLQCIFQGVTEYTYSISSTPIKFTFKKAAVLYNNSKISFKLGLDELISGVGVVWTPSDVLNPVYSLLYKEEFYKPQYRSVFFSELALYLLSNEKVSLNSKLIYLPSILHEIKTSKIAIAINFILLGYEIFLIDAFNMENPNKGYIGGYFRGNLPYIDFILPYAEVQFVSDNYKMNKWLIGLQVVPYFIKNTYFYLEYYKNSTGYKSFKDYQLQSFTYPVVGDTLINYLYAGVVSFSYSFKFSFGVIMCIDDTSGLYKITLSKEFLPNSFIEINFYNLFYRDKLNEFYEGLRKERELLLGLSIYFGT